MERKKICLNRFKKTINFEAGFGKNARKTTLFSHKPIAILFKIGILKRLNLNFFQDLKIFTVLGRFCFVFALFFLIMSCSASQKDLNVNRYYITGSKEEQEHFLELFRLLEEEKNGSEGEFAAVREIAASFAVQEDFYRLIHFLSERTINNPSDPYNAYYLLMIAYANMQLHSGPVAAMYFNLIIDNYPDLSINNESIHLVCLRQLIELNHDPERSVWYYRELISRFSDKIDLGVSYFMLGQACENIGDWNGAIEAYSNFLPYKETIVPGFPNAQSYAKQQVDFSRSSKDWTYESLPALRRAIETALNTGNARALMRCQAKVNFFARSWGHTDTDDARIADFNLSEFMYNNRIRYAPALDPSSNATEAYLRTVGWSSYLPIWYLYFRKIYFPQDPEIHGRWEWAGVYYGEKF